MSISKFKLVFAAVMTALSVLIFQSTANATGVELRQAGNACFPRTFSQLDFFLMSNGGLRNNSSTPKSIVCSFDVTYDTDNVSSVDRISLFIIGDDLVEDMECVFQIRDIAINNIAVESMTVMVPNNGGAITNEAVTFDLTGSIGQISEPHHVFVQCRLPAQGRITSLIGGYD